MPLIFNASSEKQRFQVFGNHFEMKPKEIKMFQEKQFHFIRTERGYLGLVDLPEEFEDPSYKATEEGAAALAAKEKAGIDARVAHLRKVIYNNEVSLRQDLEKSNIKADPKVFASDGELAAYRELAGYKKANDDATAERVAEMKKLEQAIKGI